MCDDTQQTNKRTKTKLSIVSSASLIPGLLMKMKTRQPSLFLIQLNEAIVNHSLTLLLIFFFKFSVLIPSRLALLFLVILIAKLMFPKKRRQRYLCKLSLFFSLHTLFLIYYWRVINRYK